MFLSSTLGQLELGIFLPAGLLGLGKTPEVDLIKLCLLKADLLFRNRMLQHIVKWLLFSSPTLKAGEDFSPNIHSDNLLHLVEVKLIKVCRLGPSGVLTFRHVYSEPPAIHQLQCYFPYSDTGFHKDFCFWVSASVNCDSLLTC